MYYYSPVTKITKYGNLELPNFKMAKSGRNGKIRSRQIQGDRKISLAHNIQVSNQVFSQNISNQLSLCINFQNLDLKSAENFQHHHFSTKSPQISTYRTAVTLYKSSAI